MVDRARASEGGAPRGGTTAEEGGIAGVRVTYVGHATLLIEIGGARFLTDPNFDASLARMLRRVSPPGIALGELPALDAILLTHAHADHLSLTSLDALRDVPLYAPAPVARWLRRLGYDEVQPLDAGSVITFGDVQVHAGAAVHSGTRYGVDRWRRAANTYLLRSSRSSCFFAGDTALTADSDRLVHDVISTASRALDVALLPIGHAPWWRPGFRRGHLTSDDALTLFERLRSRYLIPYHWGTFHHVTAGPFDAIVRLRAMLETHPRRSDVIVLEPGAAFGIDTEEGG